MSRVVEIHPVDTEEVVLLRLNGQEFQSRALRLVMMS